MNYTDASPHQSAFAKVNGVSLNYLDWGGDGPALMMVHGIDDAERARLVDGRQ